MTRLTAEHNTFILLWNKIGGSNRTRTDEPRREQFYRLPELPLSHTTKWFRDGILTLTSIHVRNCVLII